MPHAFQAVSDHRLRVELLAAAVEAHTSNAPSALKDELAFGLGALAVAHRDRGDLIRAVDEAEAALRRWRAWKQAAKSTSRPEESSGARRVLASLPKRKGLVLIVDDDPAIRGSLAEALTSEGYDVEVAANGKLALDLLRSGVIPRPRVAVIDLIMPVMNGADLVAALRADRRLSAIPVVMVTGAPPDTEARLKPAGVRSIRKPFGIAQMVGLVRLSCQHLAGE